MCSQDQFSFVVLICPVFNWSNQTLRYCFNEMISLKMAGYTARHSQFTLPLDTVDFIIKLRKTW